MNFPRSMETERLVVRWFREDDLPAISRFFSDKDCHAYLSPGVVYQVLVEDKLPLILSQWMVSYYLEDDVNTMLGVALKGTDKLVGFLGLEKRKMDVHPRIVYCVMKEHWGKGYATEASKRLLGHILSGTGCRRVEALVDLKNVASIKVAEKLGMRFEGMVHDLEFPDDQRLYAIEG
jgi:ribosomal-protein-alanine N-acetyltransferase